MRDDDDAAFRAQGLQNQVHTLTASVHKLERSALLEAERCDRQLFLARKEAELLGAQLAEVQRAHDASARAHADELASAEREIAEVRARMRELAVGARAAGLLYAVRLFLCARKRGKASIMLMSERNRAIPIRLALARRLELRCKRELGDERAAHAAECTARAAAEAELALRDAALAAARVQLAARDDALVAQERRFASLEGVRLNLERRANAFERRRADTAARLAAAQSALSHERHARAQLYARLAGAEEANGVEGVRHASPPDRSAPVLPEMGAARRPPPLRRSGAAARAAAMSVQPAVVAAAGEPGRRRTPRRSRASAFNAPAAAAAAQPSPARVAPRTVGARNSIDSAAPLAALSAAPLPSVAASASASFSGGSSDGPLARRARPRADAVGGALSSATRTMVALPLLRGGGAGDGAGDGAEQLRALMPEQLAAGMLALAQRRPRRPSASGAQRCVAAPAFEGSEEHARGTGALTSVGWFAGVAGSASQNGAHAQAVLASVFGDAQRHGIV